MDKKNGKLRLVLFVVISYAHLWLLYGIGKLFEIPFSYDPRQTGGVLVLLGTPASLIAAMIATFITQGREGTRQLFRRPLAWRFSPVWYLAALLIPLSVTGVSILAAVNTGFDIPAEWFSSAFPLGFLLFFLIYNGLGEEIGWRGLALPQLQERLGSLGGSVITGVLWALWHLPLFLMPGSSQYGSPIVPYVFFICCVTIIMALLVNKARGSVIVAILVHEAVNFVGFAVAYPRINTHLYWGAAALIAIAFLPRPLIRLPWRSEITNAPQVA
jgi:membrane protease YdiL (CAAX protease family)